MKNIINWNVYLGTLPKQHGKGPASHYPQLQQNKHRNQLNAHLGIPVYRHLPMEHKSPFVQRIPLGHARVAPNGLWYYQR